MKTFMEFLLSEIDAPTAPPPSSGQGGLSTPAAGPAGLGMGGPPPLGGTGGPPPLMGGMGPMGGGMGGGMGGPPMGDPAGGSGSQVQAPIKYKTSNVWSVLEKIANGKKVDVISKNSGNNNQSSLQYKQQQSTTPQPLPNQTMPTNPTGQMPQNYPAASGFNS